ncbi:UL16-binding protein 1-like isoform X2 [Cavia porcellus]|uniref:MHC class I-like antigen recognition-like domain-containing protein n=1 Tax=Cavia porcellus TaxID=10141 RepID=H0W4S6_CAVPO|nr:UL16-binding protein 1-like isoform X1 [Cavia porcellus]
MVFEALAGAAWKLARVPTGRGNPAAILCFFLAVLVLLLQLAEPLPVASAGTHSLFYEFIINPKPLPGQQECKIQGQLDQKIFLSYDYVGAKAISMGVLGGKLNSTKSWNYQLETLQDVATEFKQQVWDIKLEDCASTDPHFFMARMTCLQKADGNIVGFWDFGCNGKVFLHFHSNNKTWEDLLTGSRCMKKLKNVELSELLYRTSLYDCGSWLKEYLEPSEENLQTTAPPTTGAATPPTSKATRLSHRALLLILPCSLILLNVV